MDPASERAAARFVQQFVAAADPIWTALAQARWDVATGAGPQHSEKQLALRRQEHALYALPADWESILLFYEARAAYDPVMRRQVEVLFRYFRNNQSTAEENAALASLEGEIQREVFNFRVELDGRRLSDNQVIAILREATDESLRLHAWKGSKAIGTRIAPLIRSLARRRNAVAQRLGFRDHYDFSLQRQEIDEDEMFALFGELAERTEAPFRRIKKEVDQRLRRRLGLSADTPLQPWHYADPFFQEPPPVFSADLDGFFANSDIAALGARAFATMGFSVSDILARSDLYERPGKNQHAFCWRIGRNGDVRILCNLRPNARWLATFLHELGHAVYNKSLPATLPYLLRTPAHTNSSEAVAMLLGRLARDPRWLVDVAGQSPPAVAAVADELSLEVAAAQLIFLRWVLVMVHFERALYADPMRDDLNQLWWQLVTRYQRLPPTERDEPDWAAKHHIALAPVYYHNYVLGELTSSQLERWIERETEAPVQTPAAGRLLREQFFVHGAQYPWDKLIRVATGEPLRPAYYVEQFIDRA